MMLRCLVMAILLALVSPSSTLAEPEPAVIDVLVLFTSQAEHQLRNKHKKAIKDEVRLVEALQNRIFENSRVAAKVRLTAVPFDFDERIDVSAIKFSSRCGRLERDTIRITCYLAESTSAGDEFGIAKLRRDYRADLVSVWVWLDGWYTLRSASQLLSKDLYAGGTGGERSARNAYLTVIPVERVWHGWHFAHEIGHNFGLADDAHTIERLIHDDVYGHVDAEYPFRTIMSSKDECVKKTYSDCPRVPVYSTADPQVTFFGRPVGRAGRSDAARTLRMTAPFVASYSSFLNRSIRASADDR